MEGSKGRKRMTLRATKAQTMILQDSFMRSNVTSPEELKTLNEKTGLPEKWIFLWFGRQRVKARKIAIDPGPVTSNSELVPSIPSPQEILEVKMEYRDSLAPKSSSPAVPVASLVKATSDGNVSQSEKLPPKKKARVRAKKKQTTVQNNLVKDEHIGPVVGALGNSVSQPPSMAQSSISCGNSHPSRLTASPLVTLPTYPFRCIAPPSRTPFTSANVLAHPHPGEQRQSGLFRNQSYRIHPALGTSEVNTVNVQPSPEMLKSSSAAVYQQGPRFRAHFYNNGPDNYPNTRPNFGTFPALRSNHIPVRNPGFFLAEPMFPPSSDGSGLQNLPKQVGPGEYFSQSLAPAIVLEQTPKQAPLIVPPMNNYSAYPSSSSMQYIGPSTVMEGLSYPPKYPGRSNYDEGLVNVDTEDLDISTQYNLLISRMEASQSFPTFYNDALDPSLAPLKHLTDVLGRFRDQDGAYTRLTDLQEREGLMKCLLDEELARRSPFQAAMGLVLLSKLGLEWDY